MESGAEAQQREEWEPEAEANKCPSHNTDGCGRPDLLTRVVALTVLDVPYCEVDARGNGSEGDGPFENVQQDRPGHFKVNHCTTGKWHDR